MVCLPIRVGLIILYWSILNKLLKMEGSGHYRYMICRGGSIKEGCEFWYFKMGYKMNIDILRGSEIKIKVSKENCLKKMYI